MKICILTAGMNTRMGKYSELTHKALLPLDNRAVISHIIEKFGHEHSYVLALGHLTDQIKDFFSITHPDLDVTFVNVNPYRGPGSGPGMSLFCCKQYLQEPFIFTACDTVITSELPVMNCNWVGVQRVNDISNWCSTTLNKAMEVQEFHYKVPVSTPWAFVGIAGVNDYKSFWDGLESNKGLLDGELQVNNGLHALVSEGVKAIPMDWIDTGSFDNYENAKKHYKSNFTFDGKMTDFTYRYGEKIVKFFKDPLISKQRFLRGKSAKGVFANVISHINNFYSYEYIHGNLLAERMNIATCKKFLNWAEVNLWKQVKVDKDIFKDACSKFYLDKTKSRFEKYLNSFGSELDLVPIEINGMMCPTVPELLDSLCESFFDSGIPSTFHGDFHADNIIVLPNGEFSLIDWRENFGILDSIGDRYYDLAKFSHTLTLTVQAMATDGYRFDIDDKRVTLNHSNSFREIEAKETFIGYLKEFGYDLDRVKTLEGIIFINMAPLYHEKMAKYLYFLGRYGMTKALSNQKIGGSTVESQVDISKGHQGRKADNYWDNLTGGTTGQYKEKVLDELLAAYYKKNPNKILDIGIGTSPIILRYLESLRAKEAVCVDYDEKIINEMKEKYKNLPVTWLVRDIFDLKGWGSEKYDLVFFLDMLHEVYSFYGRPNRKMEEEVDHERGIQFVKKALEGASQIVSQGGAIAITDNVLTENNNRLKIKINNNSALETVKFFLEHYPCRRINVNFSDNIIEINAHDFCILLTQYNKIKNDRMDRWNIEKLEIHQYMSPREYQEIFEQLGFDFHIVVGTPDDAKKEWQDDFTVLSGHDGLPAKRVTLLAVKK